jgi:signal transduction histidine kinase
MMHLDLTVARGVVYGSGARDLEFGLAAGAGSSRYDHPKRRAEAKVAAPEKSDETVISLANLPATSRERRLVLVLAVLLFIAFVAVLPFAGMPLPEFDAFTPSFAAAIFINDLIASVLLYAQYSIARSRSLLVLASGYLFTALIVIPHALTFPGAFTPTGLIGASLQSAAWLFFFSHFVSPAVLLAYALLKDVDRANALRPSSARQAIGVSVAIVVVFVSGLTLATIAEDEYLPAIMADRTRPIRTYFVMINVSIAAVAVIALVELWARRRTVLDYWLMFICVALIQEQVLISISPGRFSLGFYAVRALWLIASIVVLILLLQETTRLYARLARSYVLLERERSNKLLSARAITASIAHEVRQPLTAIVASGGAALQYLKNAPPDHEKIGQALNRMISESHRTSAVFDSIRALFGRADQEREAVDVNDIIRVVLQSVNTELIDNDIATYHELAELPLVDCHRNQLQQVVFNLVQNALDAMQTVAGRKRVLRVRTECRGGAAVAIVVEDSGPGISPAQLDSIFAAFVTTKPHGMGLGLAICRQIVEHHGGQLVGSSDGDSGAQFQVVLPIKPTDNTA